MKKEKPIFGDDERSQEAAAIFASIEKQTQKLILMARESASHQAISALKKFPEQVSLFKGQIATLLKKQADKRSSLV